MMLSLCVEFCSNSGPSPSLSLAYNFAMIGIHCLESQGISHGKRSSVALTKSSRVLHVVCNYSDCIALNQPKSFTLVSVEFRDCCTICILKPFWVAATLKSGSWFAMCSFALSCWIVINLLLPLGHFSIIAGMIWIHKQRTHTPKHLFHNYMESIYVVFIAQICKDFLCIIK